MDRQYGLAREGSPGSGAVDAQAVIGEVRQDVSVRQILRVEYRVR